MTSTKDRDLMQILETCSLFHGVPEEEFAQITTEMQVSQVPKGRILMHRGDTTKDCYFLLSGKALGQVTSEAGKEILFTEIAPGAYFGELAALDGAPRSITISASSALVLAKLEEDAFYDMLLQHPQTAVNLASDLALRLRQMNERVFGLVVHDVDTRVRLYLMQMAQTQEQLVQDGTIENVPTHEVLARFVGANREAVSRVFARLSKSGTISTSRGKVEIHDLDKLLAGLDEGE